MTDIYRFAYVSTGKLSAMYTLWTGIVVKGSPFTPDDQYICNLAAMGNEEEAERKARDYCERLSDRIGVEVRYEGISDDPCMKRRGKLSVRDTMSLERIERGVFPFGKHFDKPLASAPDSYILYFADKHEDADAVVRALAMACMGVAMERDLIAKRDAARAERKEKDAKSNFVGEVGQRLVIEGEVVSVFLKTDVDPEYGAYYITKVRQGDDLFTYFGNQLAERGEMIKFRATVKRHSTYDDVKSTIVNRPAKVEVIAAIKPEN